MFSKIKAKLSGGAQRLSGNMDMLEAVCASCAWVAAADGDIDDSEIDQSIKAVTSNELMAAAFDARIIETTMDKMLNRANSGRMGRAGLKKEIQDIVGKDKEDRELVLLAAMDVADADGNMDDDEKKVLEAIAGLLGLKFSDYD